MTETPGALGCAGSFVALAAVVAGAWLESRTDGAAGITVVLTLVGLTTMAVAPRLSATRHARLGLPLMFAFMPLPSTIAASVDAARSIVSIGDWGFPDAGVLASALLGIPLCSGAAMALGARVGTRLFEHARPRVAAIVRALAWIATLVAAALLTLAATQMRRPTARAYVASLPIVERLSAVGAPTDRAAHEFVVREIVEDGDCIVWPTGKVTGDLPPAMRHDFLRTARFGGCGPVTVRRDDAHRCTILEDAAGKRLGFIEGEPLGPVLLLPQQLAGALRPPDAFTALATLGLAVALATLLRARRSPLGEDESTCRDAEVLADGTLRVGEETMPLPAGAHGLAGPVVAVLGRPAESFRDHAGPVVLRVVPGTLAEHRFAARVGPAAFALAFVTIASTPLLTAMLYLR